MLVLWYAVRHCCENNWSLSVDQCQLYVLKFSVYLVFLLSILLRCNGFTRIQKAVAAGHQTVIMTFLWCKFDFGKCFGASSWSNHWASHCRLSHKIHFSSHVTIWSRNGSLLHSLREDDTSKWRFFLIFSQLMRYQVHEVPTYWGFHLSNLLQMPNNHRTVNTEFFGNFSRSCMRISFNDSLNCCSIA